MVLMLLPLTARATQQNLTKVKTQTKQLSFSLRGAVLTGWEVCEPDCRNAVRQKVVHFEPPQKSLPQLQLQIKESQELTRRINAIPYRLQRTADDKYIYLNFLSGELVKGVALRKFYRIAKAPSSYEIELSLNFTGPKATEFVNSHTLGVKLFTGKGLEPLPLAGFSSGLEKVSVVKVNSETAITLNNTEADDSNIISGSMQSGDWYGIRNRFWTLLLQVQNGPVEVEADFTNQDSPQLTFYSLREAEQPLNFRIYAGPIELYHLFSTEAELDNLLYAHLWSWMRIICFGLLYLLTGLYALIGDYGVAIIALAFAVKFLMLPLTTVADNWQHEVNATHTKLQPHLQEIRANYRGEEQVKRIHALYKEHDTNMFFTLKSLFGFLIQIPVFIAVYNMLGENYALDGEPFLWIKNLAQPDHFLQLPFTTPFFGAYVNALPFIMTLVTILASLLFDAHTLSADLQRKQQRQLYMMALLFFVLFYTFPAGMVLYWTSTNLIQLSKDQFLKYFRSRKKPLATEPQ
jgi:YidC/Oxa1 family membrane protein insertase